MSQYSIDDEGIAFLDGLSGEEFVREAGAAIADPGVRGGIIVVVGAGRGTLPYSGDVQGLGKVLRRMETSGKPFVAAITGTVTGGAYEICLACHHRIATDEPATHIELSNVQAGLMPGLGGTQRLPRLIGIQRALPLLLEGRRLGPREAKEAGLVDAVAAPGSNLLESARAWILSRAGQATIQPWDAKGFRIPGGSAGHIFGPASAMLRERTMGLYPAPVAILSSVFEGCQVDLDTGLKIESRYFVHVRGTAEARNLMRLARSRQELDGLAGRPANVPIHEFSKIGVLGAGMMGSGIAYVCADAGLDVVLLDTTRESAERGRSAAAVVFDKRVSKAQLTAEERDKAVARIHATDAYDGLRGCDLVIEAVFEDRAIKAEVTRSTAAVTGDGIVFASNTSTLPITGLAEAWTNPENFIGMHFFSPVDKMPLLEIIRGKKTSDACLARAMDLAKRLRKTPIVVNDSRGFYTSRVFSTYVNEGLSMLLEGVAPALIENAGRLAGMPVGPLVLADEVSLDLMRHVREQARADLGADYRRNATDEALDIMIERCGRHGKKAGGGFYEYPEGAKKRLWPELATWFPVRAKPEVGELVVRFRCIQSLETVRCMEEGVVQDRRDADVGSVLGWGFCAALGGTIGHIETVGTDRFIAECERLERTHGKRFSVPKRLRVMALA
ncbi:MAG: enoyl-CoA hydratase/isomerase family protein [Acidobacteriia bacterium]|nr:enoyl-CoA hydratase/isomerase family protein [Terriglobia bacterium]